MPSAELEVRPATPEDTEPILDLMRLSLGEGKIPRQVEYWRWKHVENPFGPSPALVAVDGGRIVGLRVFMRWRWRVGGRDVAAVRAVDTATHPDWQGRGIFSRLTRALLESMREEGVAFVFNTPNEKSRPGYLKMGWVQVGRTSLWARPLRLTALPRALLARRGGSPDSAPWSPPAEAASAAELLAAPRLEAFCAALPDARGRYSTVPTPSYLFWRYAAIPGFDYEAIWSVEGEEGAAVVFRRKETGGLRELRLCQVLVGQGRRSQRLGRALLATLLRSAGADYATAMTTYGTVAQRVLFRSGFLPAPRLGPILTVKPLVADGVPDPLRRANWDLSIGDLELF